MLLSNVRSVCDKQRDHPDGILSLILNEAEMKSILLKMKENILLLLSQSPQSVKAALPRCIINQVPEDSYVYRLHCIVLACFLLHL